MKNIRHRAKKYLSRLGLGGGKRLNLAEYMFRGYDLGKLHLGCGNTHIPGWCNIDMIRTGATDIVLDIRNLAGISNNCADKIYSCHVLEHFAHKEITGILNRWRDVLKPGGEIRISVPDLDAITRIYQKNINHFNVPGNQPWVALIYGGQKDRYDFHKTGFNFCWLSYLLKSCGFICIERYPNYPHFIPGIIDNSLATEPFGEYISLNIMARKSK
jgi:predicted SAM-dependent methyltransferase